MDMHQKRKIRTERRNNNAEEISKTNINWYKLNYEKLPMKDYK